MTDYELGESFVFELPDGSHATGPAFLEMFEWAVIAAPMTSAEIRAADLRRQEKLLRERSILLSQNNWTIEVGAANSYRGHHYGFEHSIKGTEVGVVVAADGSAVELDWDRLAADSDEVPIRITQPSVEQGLEDAAIARVEEIEYDLMVLDVILGGGAGEDSRSGWHVVTTAITEVEAHRLKSQHEHMLRDVRVVRGIPENTNQ